MYYTTFTHPKYGEQHTDRKNKKAIMQWLSYMIFAHSITNVRIFKNGKEIFAKIPKW
jgi:hypothetical protein